VLTIVVKVCESVGIIVAGIGTSSKLLSHCRIREQGSINTVPMPDAWRIYFKEENVSQGGSID